MRGVGPTVPIARKLVFISTYPPRQCGIATFSQDLLSNIKLIAPDLSTEVFALNKTVLDSHVYPSGVVGTIDQDDPASYLAAAKQINKYSSKTTVIVQHEYGIHGGPAGKNLLSLLKNIKCPIITTFHTVVDDPDQTKKDVTQQIIDLSDRVVTLTESSANIIKKLYVGDSKLAVVPHGIHPLIYAPTLKAKKLFGLQDRKVLLTFGLLGRNKGIEYVIQSLSEVIEQYPKVMYLVVGNTHPEVLRSEGQVYRNELRELVKELGLTKNVRFVDEYIPLKTLLLYLQAADIYMATSLDPQQAVSGTLSYALGAGCAIVATEFSQAKEVLGNNQGRIVPFKNPEAITKAILSLLKDPKELSNLRTNAYASTRSMLWTNVADNYLEIAFGRSNARSLPAVKLDHIAKMTDDFGIYQFAKQSEPDLSHGFTLDDNSRALQLIAELDGHINNDKKQLAEKYLRGMRACLSYDPVVNYLSAKGEPTSQNKKEDLGDCIGRAFYALNQFAVKNAGDEKSVQNIERLIKMLPPLPLGDGLRTKAFYILGYAHRVNAGDKSLTPILKVVAEDLTGRYYKKIKGGWCWFEPILTYANGSLPAALLEAATSTGSKKYAKIGLESLDFLIKECFMGEIYVPIGSDGWYEFGKNRAIFSQQPEDSFAMMQALQSAFKLTGESRYKVLAHKAFSWYQGNNLLGVRLYNDETGGCYDGLFENGLNPNQGAESSIAYLRARIIIGRLAKG